MNLDGSCSRAQPNQMYTALSDVLQLLFRFRAVLRLRLRFCDGTRRGGALPTLFVINCGKT